MYEKKPQGLTRYLDYIFLDLLCLQAAFAIAYALRHGMRSPYLNADYRGIAIVFTLVDLIVTFCLDTMKDVQKRGYFKEFTVTVRHMLLMEAVITVYLFTIQEGHTYSRFTFYATGIFYACLTYIVRMIWKKRMQNRYAAHESASKVKMLLVTVSDRVLECLYYSDRETSGQWKVSGIAVVDKDLTGNRIEGVPVVAGKDNLEEYLCREWVDEVLVMLPADEKVTAEVLDQCAQMGITTHLELTKFATIKTGNQIVEQMGDYVMLTSSMNVMSFRQAAVKRLLDIVGAAVGCVLTGILFLIFAPLIYLQSPGPVFFAQERVGKNGKRFKMYKFRSMYLNAEERKQELMAQNRVKDGMMFKLEFDPRIIGSRILPDGTFKKGLGNFMREWSLDEFPQFFNVLKGDMSLVGTRPPTVDEWEKYKLHHRTRLAIKPGITGMWQVSGRSSITDFEEVVKLDNYYINHWDIGLDCRILLKTVRLFSQKGGAM